MPAGFRHRLSPAHRRIYDRSNAISSIPVRVSPRLARAVSLLPVALGTDYPTATEKVAKVSKVAQVICDEICDALRVGQLQVLVKGVRPIHDDAEYHGLYVSRGRVQEISVWMYTAKRRQVVAPRTFLRTLLHEVAHHLDYTLLRLGESFHTEGFFQRESSLVHQLEKAARAASRQGGAPAVPRRLAVVAAKSAP
jgi:hypothetical protein